MPRKEHSPASRELIYTQKSRKSTRRLCTYNRLSCKLKTVLLTINSVQIHFLCSITNCSARFPKKKIINLLLCTYKYIVIILVFLRICIHSNFYLEKLHSLKLCLCYAYLINYKNHKLLPFGLAHFAPYHLVGC